MHRAISLITIAFVILGIVSISLGAKIFRWEALALEGTILLWVGVAWFYETMWRS